MDANKVIKMDNLPQLAAELTPEQMQVVAGAMSETAVSSPWQECASDCNLNITICYWYQTWYVCDDDYSSGDCYPEVRLIDVEYYGGCGNG